MAELKSEFHGPTAMALHALTSLPFALAPHRLRRVVEYVDANLGGDIRLVDLATAEEIVDTFLTTEFEGGRHQRRVEKMDEIGI